MPARRPIEERFWEKVDKNGPTMPHMQTNCWVWTGSVSAQYGMLGDGAGGLIKAHRYAWIRKHGETDKCVLHHCDNPICVRDGHLYEGTQKENARDREGRGRSNHPRGDQHPARTRPECLKRGADHGNARLTEAQAISIRSEYTGRYGQQKALAEKYGVDVQTIRRVTQGKTYKMET